MGVGGIHSVGTWHNVQDYLQENGYNRLLAEIEYCSESGSDWEDY